MFQDPHALWRFDRETQIDLLAYWQIQRASDGEGARKVSKVTPASARMFLGSPATAGDLAHVWLMTHQPPKKNTRTYNLRDGMKEDPPADAVDWWFG